MSGAGTLCWEKERTTCPVRNAVVDVGPVLISGHKLAIDLWFARFAYLWYFP
jgi:hypothetical protein